MGVGAAETERADAGAPRRILRTLPLAEPVVHVERRGFEMDVGIRSLEMRRRGKLFVAERENRFDQACHTGGRIQVADVRLDRSNRTVAAFLRAERLGERLN